MAKHEHRPTVYNTGGTKTVRCSGCFELLKKGEEGEAAAPAPEPVDVEAPSADDVAPAPEPVDGAADRTRKG